MPKKLPRRRFKKGTFDLRVNAVDCKCRGNLGYHPHWNAYGLQTTWSVSHTPTGSRINKEPFNTEEEARRFILLIEGFASLSGWSFDLPFDELHPHLSQLETFIDEYVELDSDKRELIEDKLIFGGAT